MSASNLSYKFVIEVLNVILHVFVLVILFIVYVFPESVPPHVFVASSALKPEFGVTVKLTLPLHIYDAHHLTREPVHNQVFLLSPVLK